jgi:hypothetical protein
MPDRMAENLVRYLRLNQGRLGGQGRESEFAKLTEGEVASLQSMVNEAFDGCADSVKIFFAADCGGSRPGPIDSSSGTVADGGSRRFAKFCQ